jgi:predicted permease
MQVSLLLLLKLALLPALMIGLTQLMGMRNAYGLSLVLLSSCPLAPLAFLVCQQYGVGAELATSVTIQGVLLMLPQMMAIIKISQVGATWRFAVLPEKERPTAV